MAQEMLVRLQHRGPDDSGIRLFPAESDTVALGHARLSIFDPQNGHQPMSGKASRCHVTFNGAIYNYLELRRELQAEGANFSTRTDTEVLLRAYEHWGARFVQRLEGMYAFAIFDERDRSLLLGRDPFGEKPLFYTEQGSLFACASEPDALLPVLGERSFNPQALAEHLLFKYSPTGTPLLRGVHQLPPGSTALLREGRLTIRPTEDLFPACEPGGPAELRTALDDSVRTRLRADVPVGLFLSGGIDSAAIAALAATHSPGGLRAYTIDFEGGGEAFSERASAAALAADFGMEHHSIRVGSAEFADSIEHATRRRGAPLGEYNDIAMLKLAEAAARDVKVVLCGEGADELFGGYPRYWGEQYVTRAQRLVPDFALRGGVGLANRFGISDPRLAVLLRALGSREFCQRQTAWFGAMSLDEATRLAPDLLAGRDPYQSLHARFAPLGRGLDPVRAAMAFDQQVWLPENLLARGDRMTMAAPVEMRMPYLDRRLVSLARAAPISTLFKAREGKQNLRRSMAGILPAEVTGRKKHGFRAPFRQWTHGAVGKLIGDYLLCGTPLVNEFVDPSQMRGLVDAHLGGRANNEKAVWVLLSLEIYLNVARADRMAAAAAA